MNFSILNFPMLRNGLVVGKEIGSFHRSMNKVPLHTPTYNA